MRVFAMCVVTALAGDAADEDHMSVLQQRALSNDVASRLDGAVAGKKGKCNEMEAAELVSCIRVGSHTALDVLSGQETLDEAIGTIAFRNQADECGTLKKDVRCMMENPCYKWKVKQLPLDFQLGGELMRTKKVCQQFGDTKLFGDKDITLGNICDDKFQNMCQTFYDNIPEFKREWQTCGLTCAPDQVIEDAAVHDAASFNFVAQRRHNVDCGGNSVTTKADCETAAANLMYDRKGDKKHKHTFKEIRYQKRPAGCYLYKNKVWWNKVQHGSGPLRRRMPICVQRK